MKVTARLKNYRRSPKKIRQLTNLLKGIRAEEAVYQLGFIRKGFADDLAGLIKSAIANAENNFKISKEKLFIANILVEEGPVLKRWRARAYGRAAQILKRSSHITVELEERQEGSKKEKEEMRKREKAEAEENRPKKKTAKKEDLKNDAAQKDGQEHPIQEDKIGKEKGRKEREEKREREKRLIKPLCFEAKRILDLVNKSIKKGKFKI